MEKDKRINASAFTIKEFFVIFAIVFVMFAIFLTLFYNFVMRLHNGKTITLIVIPTLIASSMFIGLMFGILRKYYFKRYFTPIQQAMKQVAEGEFVVKIEPYRKDGKDDEIEILYKDFNKMVKELSNTEMMKNDFIASVSHEIKTPLSVIQNYISALEDVNLPHDIRKQYMKIVFEASKRLTDLVSNILRMSKLENQEFFSASSTFELGEQLRYCILSFEELWEQKNIEIYTDINDIRIRSDKDLLEIVWNNLLSNAIKFTDSEGEISIFLKADKDLATVIVKDTGCGIDSDEKKHIFDKFYQIDTSHSGEGNGLGLALAKKIVEIAGGNISVESELGRGSAFTVKIPLNR